MGIIEFLNSLRWSDIVIALGVAYIGYIGTTRKGKTDIAQATVEKWDNLYQKLLEQRDDAISSLTSTREELEKMNRLLEDMKQKYEVLERYFEEVTGLSVDEYTENRKGGD